MAYCAEGAQTLRCATLSILDSYASAMLGKDCGVCVLLLALEGRHIEQAPNNEGNRARMTQRLNFVGYHSQERSHKRYPAGNVNSIIKNRHSLQKKTLSVYKKSKTHSPCTVFETDVYKLGSSNYIIIVSLKTVPQALLATTCFVRGGLIRQQERPQLITCCLKPDYLFLLE